MARPRSARAKTSTTAPDTETAAEVSRMAALAGMKLSEEDAAWVANKVAQRHASAELVRKLDYRRHEPASVFMPPRYD